MFWSNVRCVYHTFNLYSKWTYPLVSVDTLIKLAFWKVVISCSGHQSCLRASPTLYFIAPFGALILWAMLKDKSSLVLDYLTMWISGRWALHKMQFMNEDEVVGWVLRGYLFTFVKTLTSSKCHLFGGVLAFKQLEIQIFQGIVVDCCCWCWSKGPNPTPLLWAKEHVAFICVHLFKKS
jgi:fucose 4-O-acetylase-like acetyltransferase